LSGHPLGRRMCRHCQVASWNENIEQCKNLGINWGLLTWG
jgi:hypothetical protein